MKKARPVLILSVMFAVFFYQWAIPGIGHCKEGDVDGNDVVNLKDAIMALKIVTSSGIVDNYNLEGDADNDDRIALPEAIVAMQYASGRRKQTLMEGEGGSFSLNEALIDPSTGSGASVQLIESDDMDTTLNRKMIESRGGGNYTWNGNIGQDEESSVVFTAMDNVVHGYISLGSESYIVEPLGDGQYTILQNDESLIPKDTDDAKVPDVDVLKQRFRSRRDSYSRTDDGSVIDVMVLYTDRLQTKYEKDLGSRIQYYVDLTNNSYENSNIQTRLRLVHTALFDDPAVMESNDIGDALDFITNSQEIVDLRDAHNADLVCLLRVYPGEGYCGLAWVMNSDAAGPHFESHATSVVQVRPMSEADPSYCSDFTFAHEIGHNLGCAHDIEHANVAGAYEYSYGHDIVDKFATVMSYDRPRKPYFSNPNVALGGDATGIVDAADNARTINQTRTIAANFRESPSTCNLLLSPSEKAFPNSGGNGTISVMTSDLCTWEAVSNDFWIDILEGGGNRSGNGTVTYSVNQNFSEGTRRFGSISVGDKTFQITQDPPAYTDGFESGDFFRLPWSVYSEGTPSCPYSPCPYTEGNWKVTTDFPESGTYAAKSVNEDSELVYLETTLNGSGGEVRYDFAIGIDDNPLGNPPAGIEGFSSNIGLKFFVDDELKTEWSTFVNYTSRTYDVPPGVHTFKWVSEQFSSSNEGESVWIDNVRIE